MRKKRSYERIIPKKLRDCRLFAIACEGSVREVRYFEQFKVLSSRIDVYMIPETNGEGEIIESRKSSPDHVLKRAERFVHSTGLTEDDQVWIVIDVDRWPMKKLTELEQICSRRNWNLAISNPCFEVWLAYHHREELDSEEHVNTSSEFKTFLATLTPEGYSPERYAPRAWTAKCNAEKADKRPEEWFPDTKRTKVYRIIDSMVSFSSKSESSKFFKDYPAYSGR